jgi:hypothetical protein
MQKCISATLERKWTRPQCISRRSVSLKQCASKRRRQRGKRHVSRVGVPKGLGLDVSGYDGVQDGLFEPACLRGTTVRVLSVIMSATMPLMSQQVSYVGCCTSAQGRGTARGHRPRGEDLPWEQNRVPGTLSQTRAGWVFAAIF